MEMQDQPTEPWRIQQPLQQPAPLQHSAALPGAKTTRPLRGISRRKLFVGLAGAGAVAAVAAGGVAAEQWIQHQTVNTSTPSSLGTNDQIGHLLRRAGFGATPDEIASYAALGYNGAVDRLLNYKQVSDDKMEQRLNALNLDLSKIQDQQRWWLLRMAWTQRPLLEKMTLFWSGHFTSSFRKVGGPKAYSRVMTQNQFLRAHAFDTFDNLLLGITADPAMLFYLDLTKSTKKAPNENYARELMELFTLGLGHYTQQDVYEAAAALTGWHVRQNSTTAYYNPKDHNTATKNFLGQSGNFDYKDIIRILANHPATPWFIGRKLFTFFAYENPSDDDVKPLVDAYVKSNHNMGEVMRTLLLSPQFNSQKAYRSRIKTPIEFVVGAYRALGIEGDGHTLPAQTTLMGQPLFDPPNVAGWPGDKVSAYWLNSGTWMARLNYIDLVALGNHAGPYQGVDLQKIVNDNHIDSPEHFVDHFNSFLLDGTLNQDRKNQFVEYFTSPLTTTGKMAQQPQITLTNGKSYPLSRVRGTLYLILSSPEYQLN